MQTNTYAFEGPCNAGMLVAPARAIMTTRHLPLPMTNKVEGLVLNGTG